MKVLSLFDGISCARVALERANIPVELYVASEVDRFAMQVSQKNYPDILHRGDVREIRGKDLLAKHGAFDLIIGGSPCQDLSIAGKRVGLTGERSGLFYEFSRLVREIKPHYFILENVASMSQTARQSITDELWGIEAVMINAALVSAQQRRRLFWVGKRQPNHYKSVPISQPQDHHIYLKDIVESGVVDRDKSLCIDANYFKGGSLKNYLEKHQRQLVLSQSESRLQVFDLPEKSRTITATIHKENVKSMLKRGKSGLFIPERIGDIGSQSQGSRVYSFNGKSVALSAHSGGHGGKTRLYACALRGRHLVDGKRKDTKGAKTQQRLEVGGDKANTITSVQKDSLLLDNWVVRKLSPIECERLQSLPDDYTEGISKTQRYKCLGNAFNVEVIVHILQEIFGGGHG